MKDNDGKSLSKKTGVESILRLDGRGLVRKKSESKGNGEKKWGRKDLTRPPCKRACDFAVVTSRKKMQLIGREATIRIEGGGVIGGLHLKTGVQERLRGEMERARLATSLRGGCVSWRGRSRKEREKTTEILKIHKVWERVVYFPQSTRKSIRS